MKHTAHAYVKSNAYSTLSSHLLPPELSLNKSRPRMYCSVSLNCYIPFLKVSTKNIYNICLFPTSSPRMDEFLYLFKVYCYCLYMPLQSTATNISQHYQIVHTWFFPIFLTAAATAGRWRWRGGLPEDALLCRMHARSDGALEMMMEIGRVGQGNVGAELVGAVRVDDDLILQALFGVSPAPHVGVRDEEDLLRRKLLQTGQTSFLPVGGHVVAVSTEGLSDTAVIRNVFTLRVDSVQLKSQTELGLHRQHQINHPRLYLIILRLDSAAVRFVTSRHWMTVVVLTIAMFNYWLIARLIDF